MGFYSKSLTQGRVKYRVTCEACVWLHTILLYKIMQQRRKNQGTIFCVYWPNPHYCYHIHHDNYYSCVKISENLIARRIWASETERVYRGLPHPALCCSELLCPYYSQNSKHTPLCIEHDEISHPVIFVFSRLCYKYNIRLITWSNLKSIFQF
jgi:hypothetical protein